jgi:hypothetical protein
LTWLLVQGVEAEHADLLAALTDRERSPVAS